MSLWLALAFCLFIALTNIFQHATIFHRSNSPVIADSRRVLMSKFKNNLVLTDLSAAEVNVDYHVNQIALLLRRCLCLGLGICYQKINN